MYSLFIFVLLLKILSLSPPVHIHNVEPKFPPTSKGLLSDYLVGRHSAESPASASVSRASRSEEDEEEDEGAW